jgi:uncharacterized OsmC-like protein
MGHADLKSEEIKLVNGVNVTQLEENIHGIQANPELAKFRFRAKNRWVFGGHNQINIGPFHGTCQEHRLDHSFKLDADEPPVLLGQDHGPNPVEYVLAALSACMTTTLVYHAAARGYKVDSIESEYDGDVDLQGFLGLRDDVRKGYQNIKVSFKVKGDISQEKIDELLHFSPVYDIVTNKVPIRVNVIKADPLGKMGSQTG